MPGTVLLRGPHDMVEGVSRVQLKQLGFVGIGIDQALALTMLPHSSRRMAYSRESR